MQGLAHDGRIEVADRDAGFFCLLIGEGGVDQNIRHMVARFCLINADPRVQGQICAVVPAAHRDVLRNGGAEELLQMLLAHECEEVVAAEAGDQLARGLEEVIEPERILAHRLVAAGIAQLVVDVLEVFQVDEAACVFRHVILLLHARTVVGDARIVGKPRQQIDVRRLFGALGHVGAAELQNKQIGDRLDPVQLRLVPGMSPPGVDHGGADGCCRRSRCGP